jgi:hypothetical protein
MKRHKAKSELEGRQGDDDDDSNDDVALMERVRLSLMRLPADIALTASSLRALLGDTLSN